MHYSTFRCCDAVFIPRPRETSKQSVPLHKLWAKTRDQSSQSYLIRKEKCVYVYMESSHVPSHSCIPWCGSHLWLKDMKQSDLAGINVACRQENTRAKWWSEVALQLIIIFIGMPWLICWQVRSYSNRMDHVTCSCWISRGEDSSKNMKYTASAFAFN